MILENLENLEMRFDPRTIEHLGISLYSKLPTVISELVSNSWDADAENILIDFIDDWKKEIYYQDDWNWMDFNELNEKFLMIWRNRRVGDGMDVTPNKNRKVIWKKWLWKLSVFWIAKEVEVITIKNGVKNHFIMNIDEILNSKDWKYNPKILEKNIDTTEINWTQIILREIKRKSNFDTNEIEVSLAKKFLIFDSISVKIKHNTTNEKIITNEKKFEGFNIQFERTFPNPDFNFWYQNFDKVKWKIVTLATPVKDPEMKWIYLTSRGKIVNIADFYWLRDTDQFHTYVTWYLEIDFIDELNEDLISTDRQSLNWEHDETKLLKDFLQQTIRKINREFTVKRKNVKIEKINIQNGLDIEAWRLRLPTYEQELSSKIIDPILEDEWIDIDDSTKIISSVIDKFENKDFKKYASDISDIVKPEEIPKLLWLMDEWKIMEARQFSDLALTRIEVIKQFENLIYWDTLEVPTLHNFLKKFTWILDPRILEFKDEVTYSKLLKETFNENDLDEKDRRIDFLCSNALWEILYVIEIKRSKYKIWLKALEQGYDYQAFLTKKYASKTWFAKVVCYVVWWEKDSDDYKFLAKEDTYWKSWEVFVKTYKELLEQAKEYHKEFIEKYNEINKTNSSTWQQ